MYQLWHKYDHVLTVEKGSITVFREDLLPFDLRHYAQITFEQWLEFLKKRVSTLHRTYMNQLYKQRRLGRGHVEVINDSGAISPVDLFWITASHLNHTWDSLQIMRDSRMETAKVSLEGILDKESYFKDKVDHISILTTKGAFPKAVYKGHILKKGDNAEYEVSAYKIGYKLGFDVAIAEEYKNGAVACTLFTNENVSMTHALEFLYPYEIETYQFIYEDAIKKFSNNPSILAQLQRLFAFNYLMSNFDFHGENFGFLYNPTTFEIIAVAPAFDFNSAFDVYGDPTAYDPYIMSVLPTFVANNPDIIEKLKDIKEVLAQEVYLNDEQKTEIISRAEYLINLHKN